MVGLTGILSIFSGSMAWRGQYYPDVPEAFFYLTGGTAGITLILALYFAFARVWVTARGNKLLIATTLFGMGIPRKFPLNRIQRMRMRNRSGHTVIGILPVGSFGWMKGPTVRDQVCEIETESEVRLFGAKLIPEHLYYMRYLILNRIQEMKGGATK